MEILWMGHNRIIFWIYINNSVRYEAKKSLIITISDKNQAVTLLIQGFTWFNPNAIPFI